MYLYFGSVMNELQIFNERLSCQFTLALLVGES